MAWAELGYLKSNLANPAGCGNCRFVILLADVGVLVTFQEGSFVLLIKSLKNVPCPLVRHFYP